MTSTRGITGSGPGRLPITRWVGSLGAALLVAGVVVLAGPDVALACSCEEPYPPRAAFEESDAVFSGRVVRVHGAGLLGAGSTIVATVQVQQVWKGPVRARLSVITESDGAACGYSFQRGREVLIYAYEHRGDLGTGLCTRTALLSEAGRDLAALGHGMVPAPEPLPVRALRPLTDRPLATALTLVIAVVVARWLRRRSRPGATSV